MKKGTFRTTNRPTAARWARRGKDETLPTTEVVVDLAQRYAGAVRSPPVDRLACPLARRQVRAAPRGL